MPAQWTGDMVGKMHNNRITMTQVAEKLGVLDEYRGSVGRKPEQDADDRAQDQSEEDEE